MAPLLIFFILSYLSASIRAEDRAHGLASESPVAISPEAYSFFHPTTDHPCAASSNCSSTMPLAATVRSTPAHESTAATTGGHGMGAGAIAGITLSVLFVCLVGMGAFYVLIKRRANLQQANNTEPVAEV